MKASHKPIQTAIGDAMDIQKIANAKKRLRNPPQSDSRLVRELALERAQQIAEFGEATMVPANMLQPSAA